MLLLRIAIPDVPGSLGAVATAMGTVGADILAVEIVERTEDAVVDDFMISLPDDRLPDALVSACNRLDGVEVMWLSHYPESWGLESDIEVLNRMISAPAEAAETLTEAAPVVFHCHWAVLADRDTRQVSFATPMAPDLTPGDLVAFEPLERLHLAQRPDGWLEFWGESACLVCPTSRGRVLVLGRQGGPEWLDSELARLRFLAGMVD